MSSNRKVLKVLSLIQFVLSICVIVLAVIAKVGSGEAVGDGGWYETARLYLSLPLSVVFGLLSIAGSVTGIRGANRPSGLGKHFLFCVLGAVFGIATLAVAGANVGVLVVAGATAAVDVAAAVFDSKVRKELEARR